MFRREMGYIVKAKNEHEVSYHPIGKAPIDFTEKELEEAFKVFALGESEFGAKEIRGVMEAVSCGSMASECNGQRICFR